MKTTKKPPGQGGFGDICATMDLLGILYIGCSAAFQRLTDCDGMVPQGGPKTEAGLRPLPEAGRMGVSPTCDLSTL